MRRFVCLLSVFAIALSTVGPVAAETEEEIVERYLKRLESKHVKKLSWVSVNYQLNRINRDNDYNSFADYTSNQFTNAEVPWLGEASAFGVDFGLSFRNQFAWTLGGEYWLKQGIDQSGTFDYSPPLGAAVQIDQLTSEIQVWGVSTGLQYFFYNPPTPETYNQGISASLNAEVGYYHVAWDLWPEYENINLTTGTTGGENTTFEGNAPSFQFGVGADIPLNVWGLSFGSEFSYMYLNFANVAWYNAQDDEIIATYNGTTDGRVDLDLSGFRGKVEIKRYFTF